MTPKRVYAYRDMEMLLASKTIAKNFSDNLGLLSEYRNNWTPEYARDLACRIDQTIDMYFGKNSRAELKDTTQNLMDIASSALRDLSLFRTQVKLDFKDKYKDILASLSFNTHYKPAKRNESQEHLIALLSGFKLGMNEELRARITSKGISDDLIDRIIGYSQELRDINTNQEVMKETSRLITRDAVTAMNSIYVEITGICKIAYNNPGLGPVLREHFNFSKIVKNMSWERK